MKSLLTRCTAFVGFIVVICSYGLSQHVPVKVAQLPPRRLSQEQKVTLKRRLAKISDKMKVRLVCPVAEVEPCEYAKDFAEVLKDTGWTIVDGGDAGTPVRGVRFSGMPLKGTFLLVSAKESSVPRTVQEILSALQSSKVQMNFQSSDDLPKGVLEIRVLYREGETPYTY
jgi:3-deoxy-D-arabino-heptulosonate 7-phosphate (DAHP) synthase